VLADALPDQPGAADLGQGGQREQQHRTHHGHGRTLTWAGLAEIAKEQRIGKLALAELDEEEHSLERLRRWWRDLKARDASGLPAAAEAETRLKACIEALEDYAERVYQAVHAPAERPGEARDA
jgi:hypothetical protein